MKNRVILKKYTNLMKQKIIDVSSEFFPPRKILYILSVRIYLSNIVFHRIFLAICFSSEYVFIKIMKICAKEVRLLLHITVTSL